MVIGRMTLHEEQILSSPVTQIHWCLKICKVPQSPSPAEEDGRMGCGTERTINSAWGGKEMQEPQEERKSMEIWLQNHDD